MSKKTQRTESSESVESVENVESVEGTETQQFDFEAALEQLEQLVSSMEDGDLSLEESLQSFEKGIKLTRECQSALNNAEQKVQKLMDDAGTTEPLAFDDQEDDN